MQDQREEEGGQRTYAGSRGSPLDCSSRPRDLSRSNGRTEGYGRRKRDDEPLERISSRSSSERSKGQTAPQLQVMLRMDI